MNWWRTIVDKYSVNRFNSPAHEDVAVLLTLNVRVARYPGLTRSISWLLMPCLLALPGLQQPWYRLLKLGTVGPRLTRGRISTTCVVLVWRNDRYCKYLFMFLLKNLACEELNWYFWNSYQLKDRNLEYFLWHCLLVNVTRSAWWLFNIGSDNDLV